MNQVIHTRGKKGFPSPILVHIVCEQPPSYYQLNSKKKCEKSLNKKKLHSYFQSEPGFKPTDLQNDTFLSTFALAHAATE